METIVPRRTAAGVAPFIRSLYDILNSQDEQIMTWVENGQAFAIVDQKALATTILPKYFRHNKYASFQRQLNYFGFRKWSKNRAAICTYSRMHFSLYHPEELVLIKRKSKASTGMGFPILPPQPLVRREYATPLSPPLELFYDDFMLIKPPQQLEFEWRHSEPATLPSSIINDLF